jgi:hypothetical protein
MITTGLGSVSLGLFNSFASFGQTNLNFLRKSPESQGVSSAGILNFINATKESGLEWHSFMLLRHGNIVAEAWWKPFKSDYKHTLYSLSKSFTSTAIGFLVQEGKIKVDDQVIKFFPDEMPLSASDNLVSMEIKHLLTMNTGHDSDTMPVLRQNEPQSWVKSFLEHPVVHQPGSHFLYNTGATYLLGAILYKITGQTLEQYLAPRLFKPLNIVGYDWEKSPQGLNTAGFGLRIKTEDIAKFGQFYLQKGKWQGKQLLSESWINEATSKQTESQSGDNDWSQGYGYQFWRCKPGFYRGDGAYGQFCMVIPEKDAVLVMTCESWNLQKTMDTAYNTILPALMNEKLKENPTDLARLKKEISELNLPVVKISKTSNLSQKYSHKQFKIDKNNFGVSALALDFEKDSCILKLTTTEGIKKIICGWEKWNVSNETVKNIFPVKYRTHVPSKIAATATWITDNTLQIDLKFVEAIHGDKLIISFNENTVSVAFLNSISENTKTFPEVRENLTGVLKS